jgi:glycosyltransferase involved in cell wall biosynthesis
MGPLVDRGALWWWYRGLRATLDRIRPDVVHVQTEPWGLLLVETLSIRALGRHDFAVCVHGADNVYHHGSRVERWLRSTVMRRTLPRLDGFASLNSRGIELAREGGLPLSAPVEVVMGPGLPNPARFSPPRDDEERRLARQEFGLPMDGVVVGLLGRLVPEKGIRDALQAVEALGANAPFLVVWGSGPMEGEVRAAFSTGRVRGSFGGALPLQTVPSALRACDIVLIPSKTSPAWIEQFGRIALEAQLSGCAVAAYASGELPRVLGEGAILVDEGDVQGLGSALLGLSGDPELRIKTAATGRRNALERFSPNVQARLLVALWKRVASQ